MDQLRVSICFIYHNCGTEGFSVITKKLLKNEFYRKAIGLYDLILSALVSHILSAERKLCHYILFYFRS
jgi:hypothetical protein